MFTELFQYAFDITKTEWYNYIFIFVVLYISLIGLDAMYPSVLKELFGDFLNTRLGMILIISGSIISLVFFVILLISMPANLTQAGRNANSELVMQGKYYIENCTLIEENINNGLFSDNTNKLQCGKTIKNITTSSYNNAVNAYKSVSVKTDQILLPLCPTRKDEICLARVKQE